jgi:hypothetical protein
MTIDHNVHSRWSGVIRGPLLSRRRRAVGALGIAVAGLGVVMAVGAVAAGWGGWQGSSDRGISLASVVPQGALLTIESRDFAGVLKQWETSKEKAAWLKSDNYEMFSRSKLFGRLGDAQGEFAKSAGLPPDLDFLHEIAGSESIFAWYDIGKLEFVYVTRLPHGSADKSKLFELRGKFTRRQVGGSEFYVRKSGAAGDGATNVVQEGEDVASGQERTVAFAINGDWLLLATREDLMASALTLLGKANRKPEQADTLLPLSAEAWFHDAQGAAAQTPGEMRMTLNLDKIVRTPYFRSYWIQRNVTAMKQYRSAVADLYLKEGSGASAIFREERVMLPQAVPGDTPGGTDTSADLNALVALLPRPVGVYRAMAQPSVETAMHALDEKLLGRATSAYSDTRVAPDEDLAVHSAGEAVDLETRLDDAPHGVVAATTQLDALKGALGNADLRAMMTISRTGAAHHDAGGAKAQGMWVPFQSAVILSSGKDWDASLMQAALQGAVAAHVTTSNLGLAWKPVSTKTGTYMEISETRPLEMVARGKLLVLCDDAAWMAELMDRLPPQAGDAVTGSANAQGAHATMIAGFDLTAERDNFARWTGLVDRKQGPASKDASGQAPEFFSGDMRSLGDAFSDLESERMVESRDGALTRQTVTYAWRR